MRAASSWTLRLIVALVLSVATLLTAGILSGSASGSGLTFLAAVPALASNTTTVSVGYADGAHNSPNSLSPFLGDPGIVSEGCLPVNVCEYDTGAVKVDNNTGADATITVIVKMDTCTFDLWPHDTVVHNGQSLVVAQTVSGASDGCPGDGTMDTSDVGPNGQGWSNNCNQSGVIPEVDVTVNGVLTVYNDTAQIINTGGVDQANCDSTTGPAGNESHTWAPIGTTTNCSANVLNLAPPAQTLATGLTGTVTATLTNNCGQPIQGATVNFNVAGGPNAGTSGSGITNSSGNASFSYSSSLTGTDFLKANIQDVVFAPQVVTITWVQPCSGAPAPGPVFFAPVLSNGGNTVTIGQKDANGYYANVYSNTNIGSATNNATPGLNSPFNNVFTKAVFGARATVKIVATDDAGCSNSFDPLFTSTIRSNGAPVTDSYNGIGQSENTVTIVNGAPGVGSLTLSVNGHVSVVGGLKAGETRSVAIGSALTAGNNTLSVTSTGKPGGNAFLLVGPGQ